MSVTSGVVSRIEVTSYTHGATALLGMQIDAGQLHINPVYSLSTPSGCPGNTVQGLQKPKAKSKLTVLNMH